MEGFFVAVRFTPACSLIMLGSFVKDTHTHAHCSATHSGHAGYVKLQTAMANSLPGTSDRAESAPCGVEI